MPYWLIFLNWIFNILSWSSFAITCLPANQSFKKVRSRRWHLQHLYAKLNTSRETAYMLHEIPQGAHTSVTLNQRDNTLWRQRKRKTCLSLEHDCFIPCSLGTTELSFFLSSWLSFGNGKLSYTNLFTREIHFVEYS